MTERYRPDVPEEKLSDELEKSPMTEEKELNNQHGIDGIQPSSKL